MIKWDGHTHSEFCRHGTGESTSLMIERAIKLGFSRYSITEHAPLPPGVIDDPVLASDFALLPDELPDYFAHVNELKKCYADKILIYSGLEVDYAVLHQDYFNEFVEEFLPHLDDIIVSLHMIAGKNGIAPIDYSPEAFESELLSCYDSINEVHQAYWNDMEKLVINGPGAGLKGRIGHLGLINKYIRQYPVKYDWDTCGPFFDRLFSLIKSNGWALDFNVAGLDKELCHDFYITDWMLKRCKHHQIDLIYGSDAHGVDSVGLHYDRYLKLIDNL
jgi:histidinol-phosphatase (PHP family)